jgi:REP element-mobilizing transposase RayT
MTHTRIYLHILWATKNNEGLLLGDVKIKLRQYLLEKSADLAAPPERISIQPEHVHLFIDLPADICLSDFMHELKGASSHWINKNGLLNKLFRWQKGFDAYSISPEDIPLLKQYLDKQQEIHDTISFQTERDEWRKGKHPQKQ